MKIHGTAKGGALSMKDFGVAFGSAAAVGCSNFPQSLSTAANGVNNGSVINTDDQHFGAGCLDFNGSSNRVQINGAVDFSTTVGSIAFWYNNASTSGCVLSFSDESTNEFLTFTINGTVIQTSMYLGSPVAQQWEMNSYTIETGDWHHVFCIQDGTAVKFYFDNEYKSTFQGDPHDESKWMTANMDVARIGCVNKNNANNTQFYEGLVQDVGLWNTAIDEDTRNTIWNDGAGAPISSLSSCAGIRAYYNCQELTNSTLTNNAVPVS